MYLPTAFFSSDIETFASGGIEYTFSSGSGLYRSHYFNMPKDYQGGGTLNTTLTVLQPITASVRLVGGGGVNGGPSGFGAGGGGGGFLQSQSVEFGTGSISIGIGMGGITGSDANERGKSGNNSTLSYGTISMLAFGGGGGGARSNQGTQNEQGKDGGSGGGSGVTAPGTTGPAGGSTLDSAQGKDGNQYVHSAFQGAPGGGGGAGVVLQSGTNGFGNGPVTESIFHGVPALYSRGSSGKASQFFEVLSGGGQQDEAVSSGSYGSCMITYQIGDINLNDTITRRFTKEKGLGAPFQIYSVEGGTGNLVETIVTGSADTFVDLCMPRQGSWVLANNGGAYAGSDSDGNFHRIPTLNSDIVIGPLGIPEKVATITIIGNC